MHSESFVEKFKADIDKIIGALNFVKTRSDFLDPIMFQQIGPSLDIDASEIEYLEESMRKSQEVPKALQQSSEMIDDSLLKLEGVEQAIVKLKDDLKAEKERMGQLIDAS